jgi:hypothetical protein
VIHRFPYLEEPLYGPPPPALPATATGRWRPLIPVTVHGTAGRFLCIGRALVDSGADDTLFPLDVATTLGVALLPTTGHGMRWRGQTYALRYGSVELELVDDLGKALRWPATVGFTVANVRYPLLGIAGCLEYLDVKFLGKDRALEVEANDLLPPAVRP